ncbi:hypothetical protein MSPP1_000564 [Malassezia sp. CBS 17886]|nr:hypothetical protein MSPP1_000564 [Malassezia sp. CBS 17886]
MVGWTLLRAAAGPTGPKPPPTDKPDAAPASRPVPRSQRVQRMETAAQDEKLEKLRRASDRVNRWSETRNKKTVWESWLAIPPRTRRALGLGAIAFSLGGIYVADWLEKTYPDRAQPRDSAHVEPQLGDETARAPQLFSISVVDRK